MASRGKNCTYFITFRQKSQGDERAGRVFFSAETEKVEKTIDKTEKTRYNKMVRETANGIADGYVEKYSRGRRGAPAKGVGRLYRRESSNLSFSANEKAVIWRTDLRFFILFFQINEKGPCTMMENRTIDDELTLIPYFPNSEVTLRWYQDPGLCKQVDNTDRVYTLETLNGMYSYLSTHGDCYYIQYRGALVGDVTLQTNGEISIVVCKEYQNRRIGRRCVAEMIALAREKGFQEVIANIYSFNVQSRKMFEAVGFRKVSEEWYSYRVRAD